MKYSLRNLALLVIITLSFAQNASAESYSRSWKRVNESIEQFLPQQAYNQAQAIFEKAIAEKNSYQILKSAVTLAQCGAEFQEENNRVSLERFQTILPLLSDKAHQAICHAMIAQGQDMLSRASTRTRHDRVVASDSISNHLFKAIELAGQAKSADYEEFFPGYDRNGLKIHPTLSDLLIHHALGISSINFDISYRDREFPLNPDLYSTADSFLKATENVDASDPAYFQILTVRKLTSLNKDSKKADIRALTDLTRLDVLKRFSKDELLVQGYISLGDTYQKQTDMCVRFYNSAAGILLKTDAVKAHDLYMKAFNSYPKGRWTQQSLQGIESLESKSLNIDFYDELAQGGYNLGHLTYSNLDRVWFRIVETGGITADNFRNGQDMLGWLVSKETIASWAMQTGNPHDYAQHEAWVSVPPIHEGNYALLASSGSSFSRDDIVTMALIDNFSIRFIHNETSHSDISGYAINPRTGQVYANCDYTVWQAERLPSGSYTDVRAIRSGTADSEGFISIGGLTRNTSYRIELSSGNHHGSAVIQYRNNPIHEVQEANNLKLFTDRGSYRPGDTLRYWGVYYWSDFTTKAQVIPDAVFTVSFMDYNYEKVYSQKNNTADHGIINGEFVIPKNIIPGDATLQMIGNGISANKYVNIESFKLESFQVIIDPSEGEKRPDVPVNITGHAISLAGIPVSGAKVSWQVDISSTNLLRPKYITETNIGRIASGESITAADGSFSLEFTVPSDMVTSLDFNSNISVSVTDLNGETRSNTQSVNFRKKSLQINHRDYLDGVLEKDSIYRHHFVLRDANHNAVEGNLHVIVKRLEWNNDPVLSQILNSEPDIYADETAQRVFAQYGIGQDIRKIEKETLIDRTYHLEKDPSPIEFPEIRGGMYRFILISDKADTTRFDTFVTSAEARNLPCSELVWSKAGKHSYEIGETAVIYLGSPVKGIPLLYSICSTKNGNIKYGKIISDGKIQKLEIPLTPDMLGTLSIAVNTMYENLCGYASEYIETVDPSRKLNVSLQTFRNVLDAGTPETWSFKVTDNLGNPVQAALILDMYDSALDGMYYNHWYFNPWDKGGYVYMDGLNIYSQWKGSSTYHPSTVPFSSRIKFRKTPSTGNLVTPYATIKSFGNTLRYGLRGSANASVEIQSDVAYAPMMKANRVAGLEIADFVTLEESELLSTSATNIMVRDNLNPTGLFRTNLVTDSMGIATLTFNAPQRLTKWIFQGIAFTDSLQTGSFNTEVVTRRNIMVEPSAPRFLRENDRMVFSVKVTNSTDKAMTATITLEMTDALTGKVINMIEGGNSMKVSIPTRSNTPASFIIKVPTGVQAITYKVTAVSGNDSDGQQEIIPVVSGRGHAVQAITLFNNGNEKRSFNFGAISKVNSKTATDKVLTVEYSTTPIWYAIQALPYLANLQDPSNISRFYNYMGACLTLGIANSNPAIRSALEEWASRTDDKLTRLEKNQELTQTLLSETPWVLDSKNEAGALSHLSRQLVYGDLELLLKENLEKLIAAQESDGGWAWISGFESSIYTTCTIMLGMGELIEAGYLEPYHQLTSAFEKAIQFIDKDLEYYYSLEERPTELSSNIMESMLVRTYFKDYEFHGSAQGAYNYFSSLAQKGQIPGMDLHFKAELAQLQQRLGLEKESKAIIASILDVSLYQEELGRWWRDNNLNESSIIQTQATLIKLLQSVPEYSKEASQAAQWLLGQRQSTQWSSSISTANAVMALLSSGYKVEVQPDITVTVGNTVLSPASGISNAGLIRQNFSQPTRSMEKITVSSGSNTATWGAAYLQYSDDLDKLGESQNGMSMAHHFSVVRRTSSGDVLEEISENTQLSVGDLIRVVITIKPERNMEYIQVKAMRPSCTEPANTHAGIRYDRSGQFSRPMYAAPGNTQDNFYIYRLNRGETMTIQYDLNVEKAGTFQTGSTTVECMYAPEFRAHTQSRLLQVK